jgi:hypothetical protein
MNSDAFATAVRHDWQMCADQAEIDSGKEEQENSHNKLIPQLFVQ